MNPKEIEQQLDNWQNCQELTVHLMRFPGQLPLLMTVLADDSNKRNWVAAWVLDKVNEKKPKLLENLLPRIAQLAMQTGNQSKLRHYLKILSLHPIPEALSGQLFERCFLIFTNPSFAVAVRVHAMQILYEISQSEPELKPELVGLIENEMEIHPTAGIKSRGKRLLTLLRKQINR